MKNEVFWMFGFLARSVRRWGAQQRVNFHEWQSFWKSYKQYEAIAPPNNKPLLKDLYPCLGEATGTTSIEPIYFYQDSWAFEKIVKNKPPHHVDVGSHHKFVAFLSKVVPVTMVDIRPLSLSLETLQFRQGSILDLPFEDGTVSSFSSLCVMEHIGLGRYGDPLDPFGTEKAIAEVRRILAPGADFYFSVPIDDVNRVYFNAHRAFSESYLFEQFEQLTVIEARYIFGGRFMHQPMPGFGVGCYHLRRV